MAAALAVFMREGYAASVDSVAAEAGVSKQTVYSYFGSKETLFRSCFEETKRELYDELASAGDLRAGLLGYARSALTYLFSPEAIAMQRLLASQATAFPELAKIYDEAGPARSRAHLAAFLGKAVEAGRLRREDPVRLAEDFVALAVGTRRHRLLIGLDQPPGPAELEEQAARAVEVFLRAHAP